MTQKSLARLLPSVRARHKTLFALLFATGLGPLAAASQTNFMVSPPPLPWFEFDKGQWDLRVGGNYTRVSGKDSTTNKDVAVTGGGFNAVGRYAFTDLIAVDFGYYFVGITGGVPSLFDVYVYMNTWNPNLELQVLKTERVSWIIFFGGMWSLTPVEIVDRSTAKNTSTGITVFLSGPQFGTQLSAKAGSFALSPFVLVQSLSGTASVSYPATTTAVPTFTMTSFGIDITYIPWSITLSSVFNQASAATQSNGYNTLYLALSYDFRWGMAPAAPAEPAPEPVPEPVKKKPGKRR